MIDLSFSLPPSLLFPPHSSLFSFSFLLPLQHHLFPSHSSPFFTHFSVSPHTGVVGILKASEVNTCADTNATDCVLLIDVTTDISAGGQDTTGQAGRTLEWVWWLLGSSGCGVVFSLVCMCALWVLIEVIRKFQIIEKDEKDSGKRER